ncbi:TPA: trp operon leader peptide [Escherichia coli]|nr:trp operon leader peptide [Escherichia coli]
MKAIFVLKGWWRSS